MTGKQRCQVLKKVRRQIAEANEIPCAEQPCGHEGDCPGTCPRCEQELRQLEASLARRRRLGKAVVVAGVSASMALSLGGCSAVEVVRALTGLGQTPNGGEVTQLEGEVAMPTAEPDVEVLEGVVACEPTPDSNDPVELTGDVYVPDEESDGN